MMQFHKCRKREMMSSIRLQHYDVTSCKQCHLIKIYWYKGVSTCYNHRKFGKVSFIFDRVIAFSKKVHVFLRHPVYSFIFHRFVVFMWVVALLPKMSLVVGQLLVIHDISTRDTSTSKQTSIEAILGNKSLYKQLFSLNQSIRIV